MANTSYTVGPMPGDSTRWRVLANGHQVSRHNTKRNARAKAKKLADRNDTITVQKANGEFQTRLQG